MGGSPSNGRCPLGVVEVRRRVSTCCYSERPVFVRILALFPFSFLLRTALHSSYSDFRVYLSDLHNNALDLCETPSRLGLHNNALGLRETPSRLSLHNNALGLRETPSRLGLHNNALVCVRLHHDLVA